MTDVIELSSFLLGTAGGVLQLAQLCAIFFDEPAIYKRSIFIMKIDRKMKKAGVNLSPALWVTAAAFPIRISAPIDTVVKGYLVVRRKDSQGDNIANAINSSDIGIRTAAVVHMPLRRLHEDHLSAGEIITMVFMFPVFWIKWAA